MVRTSWVLAAALAITGLTGLANADTVLPGDASVRFAANSDGFYVNATGQDLFGAHSYAESLPAGASAWVTEAGADATGYADAGIVIGFDGSLTLGQLQGVIVNLLPNAQGIAPQTTPSINLWIDSGNDGQFFSFTGDQFTGLNGDSYFGAAAGNIDQNTSFSFLGGSAGAGTFTLSQLQNGADAGINGNTKVALWIGVTNGTYENPNYADIASVDVITGGGSAAPAAPLPASVWSGLTLLAGMGLYAGIKRKQTRLA